MLIDTFCTNPSRTPGTLKIKSTGKSINIEHLSGKKQVWMQFAFKSFKIDDEIEIKYANEYWQSDY